MRAPRARIHEACVPRRRTMSLPTHTRPRLCKHHRGVHRKAPRAVQRGGQYPAWWLVGRRASQRRARRARSACFHFW